MLSKLSRALTYLTAALAAITGAILFFAPERVAPVFAWSVTPFMTMTIGAWCLGNAWLALLTARRWDWTLTVAPQNYLWLFGILETVVLLIFRDKLVLEHPIAWLYLAMIGANLLTAISGIVDWLRVRPSLRPPAAPYQPIVLMLNWAFVLGVTFLGVYGLFAPMGAPGTSGGIFPEIMTPFTLRAFGAFYLSLGLSAVPLALIRNLNSTLFYSIAAYGLIITVTAATVVYWHLFHLADAPGGSAYIGAYLLVGVVIGSIIFLNRAILKDLFAVG